MKLPTQITLCLALLPLAAQALPAAGPASASSASASSSNDRQNVVTNDQQAAADVTDGNNNKNNNNTNTADQQGEQAIQDVNPNHKPSDQQILNAVMSWMNDTGKVSAFLNTATSFSGDEFTRQATIALNAELDELNHKQVLDDALLAGDAAVRAADDVLAGQGTFQQVVDVLGLMADQGPDAAQAQVDEINRNRCVNVLPNIDAYFAAAGQPDVSAVRPRGCVEITDPPNVAGAAATAAAAASTSTSVAEADAAEVTDAAAASSSSSGTGADASADATGSEGAAAAMATAAAEDDEEEADEDDEDEEEADEAEDD